MIHEYTKNKIKAYVFLGLFLWIQCYFCSFENLKDLAISGVIALNYV